MTLAVSSSCLLCAAPQRLGSSRRRPSIVMPGLQKRRCRPSAAAAAASSGSSSSSARSRLRAAAVAQDDDGFCMPAYVLADNTRSKCFTVLDVEVWDYPGEGGRGRMSGWLPLAGFGFRRRVAEAGEDKLRQRCAGLVPHCCWFRPARTPCTWLHCA